MLIRHAPQVVTVEHRRCPFHEKHPGGHWAGCTCSVSYVSRDKTWEEMTEGERKFMLDPYPGAIIPE